MDTKGCSWGLYIDQLAPVLRPDGVHLSALGHGDAALPGRRQRRTRPAKWNSASPGRSSRGPEASVNPSPVNTFCVINRGGAHHVPLDERPYLGDRIPLPQVLVLTEKATAPPV